jgi:hypothetical protein
MQYSCGCEAIGDNVAVFCPVHDKPLLSLLNAGGSVGSSDLLPSAATADLETTVYSSPIAVRENAIYREKELWNLFLCKLPSFDPCWSPEVKVAWFCAMREMIAWEREIS